jgi:hypothetical protein
MDTTNCGKRIAKICAISAIKKTSKVNNHQLGENSPNLVTLSIAEDNAEMGQ